MFLSLFLNKMTLEMILFSGRWTHITDPQLLEFGLVQQVFSVFCFWTLVLNALVVNVVCIPEDICLDIRDSGP